MTPRPMITSVVASVLSTLLVASAHAQTASPRRFQTYDLASGLLGNSSHDYVVAADATIHIPGALWLQLHVEDYNLGQGSSITMTSALDGGTQRQDSTTLPQWRNASAFFNGDRVQIRLHVAPGESGIYYRVTGVTIGEPGLGSQSQCGDNDDRAGSNDPRVGRTFPVGCTGWIVSNGTLLSAGHCVGADFTNIEFNVPDSQCDGTIVHSHPDDQYAIERREFHDDGSGEDGNDWCVFSCFRNPNTGLLPVEAQGDFFRMTRDHDPNSVRVTGFGIDSVPAGCQSGLNSDSQTAQTEAGHFMGEEVQGDKDVTLEYRVDTEEGNSGSPVISEELSGVTIGIHTNGGCFPPFVGNKGTGFENDALEDALQTFFAAVVVYVDSEHPIASQDGTVFRPWHFLTDGLNQVPSGGMLSLVRGSYPGTRTITRAMTIVAPAGVVTIGK